MTIVILTPFVILPVLMSIAWLAQRMTGNAGWTDFFWTVGVGASGVILALFPEEHSVPWRQALSAMLALIWALRLSIHLARRTIRSTHEDRRYAHFREVWGVNFPRRIFLFMQLQGPFGAALAYCIYIAAHNRSDHFGVFDALGVLVFAVALIGEALADAQLAKFIQQEQRARMVCDIGLWAWSRHPNYFFEWLIWWTWPLLCFDSDALWRAPFAAVAPLMMLWLLTKVSGIPPLESAMVQSRGELYRTYQQRVSAFFPKPPKQ